MFNPFKEKVAKIDDCFFDWKAIYPKSYSKYNVDPYSKLRIILMNGIEVFAVMNSHNFHRHCTNNDLRREIAISRMIEQQQQKHINWLKPLDETVLETTIGYEHVAVDLTAWLAKNEPDSQVKAALDFALLEDFDHLYRYANLLDIDGDIPAHKLVLNYVDITPGRPTISEHRYPADSVKAPLNFKKANLRSILNTMIITAAEQQTMNFYMNAGNTYENDIGRKLYQEIALIEEQHVSHYGSLLDPKSTYLECMLMQEYMECYLYYSFYEDETDKNLKSIWELHLNQELAHLQHAVYLLEKYEKKDYAEYIREKEFPKLLKFEDTRSYVRDILENQVELTSDGESYNEVSALPDDHNFFFYQDIVNQPIANVPSHAVISRHQKEKGKDYRAESAVNPVFELTDRRKDNTKIGRTAKVQSR